MNKKLLLSLFAVSTTTLSVAQAPSLTAANIQPALNDSFISIVCDTTGVGQGPAGVSQTWDFHALTASTLVFPIDTGHVIYASTAPGYTLLSLVPGFAAELAVVSPQSTATNYFHETSTGLYNPGFYIDNNNNAIYSPAIQVLQFPFTYGNSFTTPYSGAITILGITATESGTATVNADGYGTLILPPVPPSSTNRTFTGVLRVYTHQLFRDSAAIFGSIQTDTVETYTWYQPGYHSALLTINTVKGTALNTKSVSYAQKQIANHELVPSIGLNSSLRVFPNPAGNLINIEFENNTNSPVRASLTDMLGHEVAIIADKLPVGYNQVSYNSSQIARGTYLLTLHSASETVTRKVEIQ